MIGTGKVDVGGTILRGAFAKWFGDPIDSNPYPDMPGYYVLHRAWRHGYLNSDEVLDDHDNLTAITAARRADAERRGRDL